MGVRIGSGLSERLDPADGALEAATLARDGLAGGSADLVFVFCSGLHLSDPVTTLAAVRDVLDPGVLVGCGASGVVGAGREIEGGTAISVWAADLGEGRAMPFHARAVPMDEGFAIEGLPAPEDASAVILLPDPSTFPTERVLPEMHRVAPAVPLLGGLASGRTPAGDGVLLLDDEVLTEGCVGVLLEGLELLPCVSQGAAPVGPELTVTACEGNVITELAGRPALQRLREVLEEELSHTERDMLSGGLLLGTVIDTGQVEYVQGDFLVAGLLGVDAEAETVAVSGRAEVGQVVRLHARDAASADLELRDALGLRRLALGGRVPSGALLFTCNGRGEGMFGIPDHDSSVVEDAFGGAPAAGFFAAGEIGPVGGEAFVHAFTATLAVFA